MVCRWGSGKYGQLGCGTRLDSRYPKAVALELDAVEAAAIGKLNMACSTSSTSACPVLLVANLLLLVAAVVCCCLVVVG